MTLSSKHPIIDLIAEILQALTDGRRLLLGVLPFQVHDLNGTRVILIHPKKFASSQVGSDVSPHKLAECVALVKDNKVVIVHASANFEREWSALCEL